MPVRRGKRLRVGVIFGGRSGEHEVSLVSGKAVMAHLDRGKYQVTPILISREGAWTPDWTALRGLDVVFPVLHGPYGEDGTIQGMLEMLGLPYVGAGVLGSAAAMDKEVAKRLFLASGLPVGPYVTVDATEWSAAPRKATARIEKALRYPIFVKPANMGSSVGISKVRGRAGLAAALREAFRFDDKLVIEQGIEAREIECAVLGNRDPQAAAPGEVIPGREFYDYAAKYADAGSRTLVPAPIPARTARAVRELAVRAYQACGCEGLARVDFFLARRTGKLYLNEINTMPGFTSISMYPMMWAASGVPFPALLDRLIGLALERSRRRGRRRVLPSRVPINV
ncbi:MAG TPA: D-alanine--D-alanine ligase family protein [Terriglobales bacterium]|nr:D-alanine--D-alanine ligase family protein [Terriglobales bacterium]